MMSVITSALDAVRAAAIQQTRQLTNELNAASDALSAAAAIFNDRMVKIQHEREATDKRQAEAVRDMDTAMTQTTAIMLALRTQLESGELVTGSDSAIMKRIANGTGGRPD